MTANAARSERDREDEDDELDWAEEDFVFDDLDFEFETGAGQGGQGSGASGSGGFADDEFDYGDSGFDLDFEPTRTPGEELIGDLDPATPPVVGDWTERE